MKKVMLVTGATGDIGSAVARLAAAQGYNLALTYHQNHAVAGSLALELRAKGCPVLVLAKPTVDTLVATVLKHYGTLDAVVYCAAAIPRRQNIWNMDPITLRAQTYTNLTEPIELVISLSRCIPGLNPSVVLLSSEAGTHGGVNISAYAAAKGGINAFVKGAARELSGMRINAVSPGLIESRAVSEGGGDLEALAHSLPMKRFGLPAEVAATALWLCSDEASYITGAIIPVAGGR